MATRETGVVVMAPGGSEPQVGNEGQRGSDRGKRIMLVIGEASGDLHGAQLVRALRERDPTVEVFGVGGKNLKEAGIGILVDAARLAGMGFSELIGHIGSIARAYCVLRTALKRARPDLLVLIDFPEFNLRLARFARKVGVPVLYYVSPQVWAWRSGRVRKIARSVDRMAVIFPFEAQLYRREKLDVTFVGHPLLDTVRPNQSREATLRNHGLAPGMTTIALFPGSRRREVASHLPRMVEAAVLLRARMSVQFLLVRASTLDRTEIERRLAAAAVPIAIADGNPYDILHACDLAWVASGTATLEAALLAKPMVILYRLSWLTYLLARLLVRVEHIGMVNILAEERVVPELIQTEVNAANIVRETENILGDPAKRNEIIGKLAAVRKQLGSPGAAGRVADMAYSMMGGVHRV